MIKLKSLAAGLLLGAFFMGSASAQSGIGQLQPGQVFANATATKGLGGPTALSPLLNRGFCSTASNFLANISGTWGCASLSAELSFTGSVFGVTAAGIHSAMLNADVFSTAHSWAGVQTFTTPILGAATATSINGNIWTAGTGTLTIAAGKTLTANSSISLTGTDGKTLSIGNSMTLLGVDATVLTFQGTDTYVGRATTDTLTNKSIDGSEITSGTIAAARGGAGAITGALKANGAGVVSQAACADLSNGGTACSQTYSASTWTPTFIGSTTAGTGQAYVTQVGSYEQIGRHVTVRFTINSSSLGTAAGNIQISGLPLTAGATASDFGICWIGFYTVTGLLASNFGIVGFIQPSSNVIGLYSNGNAGTTAITIAQAGASANIIGACEYHT